MIVATTLATFGINPVPVSLLHQVVVNYVAMTPEGRIFENSLEKTPYDIRVGAGAVVPGLDEGLLSMKVRGAMACGKPHCTRYSQAAKSQHT
jgi:FKBP-type peptidyl-prolyl cis-trans isomerase